MLKSALNNAVLHPSADERPIQSEALELIAKQYFLAEAVIDRLSRFTAPEAARPADSAHPVTDDAEQAQRSANSLKRLR